jgi:transposase-like protein
MNTKNIKKYFLTLNLVEQTELLSELEAVQNNAEHSLLDIREYKLNNKQGSCPHCGNEKYTKSGKYKDNQRYKCCKCKRTFSPYTGTWLAQIHKKSLLNSYLKLMQQGLSLDKIKNRLQINKKTAFDWRHKITQSLSASDTDTFEGITEGDETFFLHSETGSGKLTRTARKRGKAMKKRGIGKEQVAVIAVSDRNHNLSLRASCFGRVTKKDIAKVLSGKISSNTVLCSDYHVSYKGFAKDNNIEHHSVKSSIKEFVKQKVYHVQTVNSLHSRLKKWINRDLYGVATKYLQNYLHWFRFKEKYKTKNYIEQIISQSIDNTQARNRYLLDKKLIYSGITTPF